jgi:endonuclease YncB( thermonuclease family)
MLSLLAVDAATVISVGDGDTLRVANHGKESQSGGLH